MGVGFFRGLKVLASSLYIEVSVTRRHRSASLLNRLNLWILHENSGLPMFCERCRLAIADWYVAGRQKHYTRILILIKKSWVME